MAISEKELGELIELAAKNNELPVIKRVSRPFSPGFLDVFLCGKEVGSFDTYYYTAENESNVLVSKLTKRINDCASKIIAEQAAKITELEKELSTVVSGLFSEKELQARDIEQQSKGVREFFDLNQPYISMGTSKMWRIDDVIVDEHIKQLSEGFAA